METMRNALQEIRAIYLAIPVDIVGIVVFIAFVDGLIFNLSTSFPLTRAVAGIVMVLFVPGYLLLAIVYPRQSAQTGEEGPLQSTRMQTNLRRLASGGAPSWSERILLSFGLSLALIPLLALLVAPASGSLSQGAVVTGLNAVVLLGVGIALVRRTLVPSEDRLRLSIRSRVASVNVFFSKKNHSGQFLSVVFFLSVLIASVTMGFVVLSPGDGEAYSSLSVLSENENGELLASGYPEEITQGSDAELAIRVENSVDSETDYTAVGVIQRVEASEQSVTVTETERVFRDQATVADAGTWTTTHSFAPEMVGENLRLQYYLYKGAPPENVNEDTAYRTVSLWTSVSSAE